MPVFFSIGIPAYKAKFLKECIDSILAQRYTNFELIIVNDASPENIDAIVHQYADDRIQYYINEKNFGAEHVVDNWNKCLSKAKGDYFILMGDDDQMAPEYLDEFTKLIDKYPGLNVYHCRSYIINEESQKIGLTQSWPEFESVYDNIWHRINDYRDQYISDFVYNRKFLVEQGGFYKLPLAWASDDISAYIAMKNKGIAHINIPLLHYRVNAQTISLTGNAKLKLKAALLEEKWFSSFLKEVPEKDIDQMIHSLISEKIPAYFYTKKVLFIIQSLKKQWMKNLLFWLATGRKIGVPKRLVGYAFYIFFKESTLAFFGKIMKRAPKTNSVTTN
jgi:glycosyltransferase involved in cell wall biosynthesis